MKLISETGSELRERLEIDETTLQHMATISHHTQARAAQIEKCKGSPQINYANPQQTFYYAHI